MLKTLCAQDTKFKFFTVIFFNRCFINPSFLAFVHSQIFSITLHYIVQWSFNEKFYRNYKRKIVNNIHVNKIEIIDNTHIHKRHKSFNKSKLHLKIIIESDFLKSLEKIDAHKKITNLLKEEIETKIHSLEIKIN